MNQIMKKIIASILVMTLTCANLVLLGTYAYAAADELETQNTIIKDKVEFDVYFMEESGNKVHSKLENIQSTDRKMYVAINVLEGYLRNTKIQMPDSNFVMENVSANYDQIQSMDVTTITLNQIEGEVVFEIPIKINANEKSINVNYFSKVNEISIDGSLITDKAKTVKIENTIKLQLEFTGTANLLMQQGVVKYAPYQIGEESGVLLQTVVRTNIENDVLPIQETVLKVTVPSLKELKPTKVNVAANSLAATNGDESGITFEQQNWSYNEQEGTITITVKNEQNENNEVAWVKNGKDEYYITYIYKNAVMEENMQVALKTEAQVKTYGVGEIVANKLEQIDGTLAEQVGNIANFEIKTNVDSIAKGYLYTNNYYQTEYETTWIADLGYVDLMDKVEFKQSTDTFLDASGKTYSTSVAGTNYAYYKSTTISKNNMTKILGDQDSAYIEICDENGNLIQKIDKNTQANDQGNIVINYQVDVNNIIIRTSKPVKEGKLEIKHTKAIKEKTDYSKEQVKTFVALKTDYTATVNNGENIIVQMTKEKQIALEETKTKIETSISNTNLSTVLENENVEIRAVLMNNDNTMDLYKNPVVEFVLPNYIERLEVKESNLLFDEELKIANVSASKNANGNNVITVAIEGEQTKYNLNNNVKGATIVLNTDIIVNQLTPSMQDTIQVYVTNQNVTAYENEVEGKGNKNIDIQFVAPVGMVAVNSIANYNLENEKAISSNGNETVGKLAIQSGAKTATMELTIINNYNAICKNVNILGRFPFEGNKSITSGEDLGSTFTTILKSAIRTISGIDSSNVVVYYTQKEDATNDLNNSENGWTTEPMSDAKSYLIVLNNYEMQKGQTLQFAYDVEIPENLTHNQSTYGTYVVYFDNVTEEQTIKDQTIAPRVGVSTMEGPELNINMSANVKNGEKVQEGEIIKYEIYVSNNGGADASNVKVTSPVPEGCVYVTYVPANTDGYGPAYYDEDTEKKTVEQIIENIPAGDTEVVEYRVKVLPLDNEANKVIEAYATAEMNENGETYIVNTLGENNDGSFKNPVEKGCIKVKFENTTKTTMNENTEITYTTTITNVNNETKTNLVVEQDVPDGLEFIEAKTSVDDVLNVTQDTQNKKIICNLGELKGRKSIALYITLKTKQLEESEKQISTKTSVKCEQLDEAISKDVTFKVVKPELEIKQTSSVAPGKIAVGDTITYEIEVKNIGTGDANNAEVTDYLPEQLKHIETVYTIGDSTGKETLSSFSVQTVKVTIGAGKTLNISITAQVRELRKNQSNEMTNVVKVSARNVEEIEANSITHTIDGVSSGTNQTGGNGNTETKEPTYRIAGNVWEDTNENGKRDDSEKTLEGIEAILINGATGARITTTTTDQSGKYSFSNLENGKYMVAFLYDDGFYMVTDYKKAGVKETVNSDAIENKIVMDDTTLTGAVTDNININNESVYNIDLGLVARDKFDLSLSKTITNITVQTTKGTKNYDYENGTTLAKIDIAPKRIEGANVVIEYQLTVKNEGTVAGYVNKIVDYLPSELKFNSSMNTNWYQAENGALFNLELADTLIEPGETKTVSLVLTKTMTGESTGVFNNTAEIYEAYNDLGLTDINSTPANKAQNENDLGSADVLLTVNTGENIVYVIVTLICLGALGAGIYLINKKILRKTI